jgi:NAD(P)H-nitrite reductase large subunit
MLDSEVTGIDPSGKTVGLADGRTVEYDQLLISAGARPIAPPDLLGLDGVHVMGTLDSALGIRSHAERGVDRAVVVGGGFMGIESAVELRKYGIDVTVVELLPHVLSRMLDPEGAEWVERLLDGNGVDVILNDSVKAVNGDGKVESVSLGQSDIQCDMVVVAIGVAPNIGFLKGTGIDVNRGIVVDGTMSTNVPDIYAAGDIAEVREQITGTTGSFAIWPNAIEQGRVAGSNMANVQLEYAGADIVNILDVFDTPVVTMGMTSEMLGDVETLARTTPHDHKRIMLSEGRMLGVQFIGNIRNTGPLYGLMTRGIDVSGLGERLLDDDLVIDPEVLEPGAL